MGWREPPHPTCPQPPGLRTSVTWLLQGLEKPQHWGTGLAGPSQRICNVGIHGCRSPTAAEIAKPRGKRSCSHLIIGSRDYPTELGEASALLTLTVGDLLL